MIKRSQVQNLAILLLCNNFVQAVYTHISKQHNLVLFAYHCLR